MGVQVLRDALRNGRHAIFAQLPADPMNQSESPLPASRKQRSRETHFETSISIARAGRPSPRMSARARMNWRGAMISYSGPLVGRQRRWHPNRPNHSPRKRSRDDTQSTCAPAVLLSECFLPLPLLRRSALCPLSSASFLAKTRSISQSRAARCVPNHHSRGLVSPASLTFLLQIFTHSLAQLLSQRLGGTMGDPVDSREEVRPHSQFARNLDLATLSKARSMTD